jgi:hypothetical protein
MSNWIRKTAAGALARTAHWHAQRETAAEVESVMRAPVPKNDPRLRELVRVRVRRPFRVKGAVVAVGDVVELERHDAESLAAAGRVRLL